MPLIIINLFAFLQFLYRWIKYSSTTITLRFIQRLIPGCLTPMNISISLSCFTTIPPSFTYNKYFFILFLKKYFHLASHQSPHTVLLCSVHTVRTVLLLRFLDNIQEAWYWLTYIKTRWEVSRPGRNWTHTQRHTLKETDRKEKKWEIKWSEVKWSKKRQVTKRKKVLLLNDTESQEILYTNEKKRR